jgi:hypothetical protein
LPDTNAGGRRATPRHPLHIATIALLLSTADSSFIKGGLITADGGLAMNGDVHMA